MGWDLSGCIEIYREDIDFVDDYLQTYKTSNKWVTILDLGYLGRDSGFMYGVFSIGNDFDDCVPVPEDSSFFDNHGNVTQVFSSHENCIGFKEFIRRYESITENEEQKLNLSFFKRLESWYNYDEPKDLLRVVMFYSY